VQRPRSGHFGGIGKTEMENTYTHMKGSGLLARVIDLIGQVSRWLAVAMVLLQFVVVVARYLFDAGAVMAQEAILYLFGTMFMLAMADTLASDRHVRVDMIYHGLSPRWRRRIDAAGILLFLLPLCLFMLWTSKDYVLSSWAAREASREAAGLPGVFVFKTVIPVALTLVILQALAVLFRCLRVGGRADG